jgi:hypothetical protein
MRITKHETSYVVELEDSSSWRVWPGDIAATLQWLATADIEVVESDDELCSHVLIDRTTGSRVQVIEASKDWPVGKVRRSLREG